MTVYCTRADMEAVWNPADLLAAVDDDQDGVLSGTESSHIDRAIARGADELRSFLEQRYAADDLAGHSWCRDANAVLAACLAAGRRGAVPAALADQGRRIRELLCELRAGHVRLPGVADRSDGLPRATNIVV